MFGHLKISRALAIPTDNWPAACAGMVHLATTLYWL
jgi:hypothetical protein